MPTKYIYKNTYNITQDLVAITNGQNWLLFLETNKHSHMNCACAGTVFFLRDKYIAALTPVLKIAV